MSEENRSTRRDDSFNGTRKLIRPRLQLGGRRRDAGTAEDPMSRAMAGDSKAGVESSHAEAFYFQKQIQQQTDMTIVLEDGEELQGTIEWYDRGVIKLRTPRGRVMVYKPGIKYLYKTSEAQARPSVMK